MRLFTPEVDEVFRWFALTYDLEIGFGFARYRRIALPEAGGLDEQPARLLQQLAWVAEQKNAALMREAPARRRRRKRTRDDG